MCNPVQSTPHVGVFVDLKIDFAFKYVFGRKGNEDLLLMLVNAILPEQNITSVELAEQEHLGPRPDSRRTVFDINCRTSSGKLLNIEMQYRCQADFSERIVMYASYPILNNFVRGSSGYTIDPPLYVIGITNFILPRVKDNDRFINHYGIKNEDGIELTGNVHYVTVELPKFTKGLGELGSQAEKLFYTLINMAALEDRPEEFSGQDFEKLFETSKFAAMNMTIQREYLLEMMAEMDERSRLSTARHEGLQESKVTIAKTLLAKGLDVSLISECTGLSKEAIAELLS